MMRRLIIVCLVLLIMPITRNNLATRLVRQQQRGAVDYGEIRARRQFDPRNHERFVNDLTAKLSGGNASIQKAIGQHTGNLVDDRGSGNRQTPPPPKDPGGGFTRTPTDSFETSGKGGGGFDTSGKGGGEFDTGGKGGGKGGEKDTNIIVGGQDATSAIVQASSNNRTGPQIRPE